MKYFKVILSNKQEIIIDEDDYRKVAMGMNSGAFIKVKKAIINPSFIQNITPISQQEALQGEYVPEKIEGEMGTDANGKPVFKVTSRKPGLIPTNLKDEMTP